MNNATIKFFVAHDGKRWLKLEVAGDIWGEDWAIPYSYLESWGMIPWFLNVPSVAEGLKVDTLYRMSDTPILQEFDTFINNLHLLISEIKPVKLPESQFTLIDRRDYP